MKRLLIPLLALGLCHGCSRKRAQEPMPEGPRTRARAEALLRQAVKARDPGAIHDLLDKQSRWPVISIHKNLNQICSLVETRYRRSAGRGSWSAARPRPGPPTLGPTLGGDLLFVRGAAPVQRRGRPEDPLPRQAGHP